MDYTKATLTVSHTQTTLTYLARALKAHMNNPTTQTEMEVHAWINGIPSINERLDVLQADLHQARVDQKKPFWRR